MLGCFLHGSQGQNESLSGAHVVRRKAVHIDGVFRESRAARCQLEGLQVFDSARQADGHGDGVDPLLNSLPAHDLAAEDYPAV
jgi:hypothetical protein